MAGVRARGIGVHDNFFILGGDSVPKHSDRSKSKSTRTEPQAQTSSNIRPSPTPKSHGTGAAATPNRGSSPLPATLTPIQCWFFEQELPQPQHWNQAVMLEIRRNES